MPAPGSQGSPLPQHGRQELRHMQVENLHYKEGSRRVWVGLRGEEMYP